MQSLAASRAKGVYEIVVKQSLPTLCTAIANAKPNESWVAGSAIDLVTSLIRGSPESGLGEGFFAHLAPNLFNCLELADDRDVLQVHSSFFDTIFTLIVPPERYCVHHCNYSQRLPSSPCLVRRQLSVWIGSHTQIDRQNSTQ